MGYMRVRGCANLIGAVTMVVFSAVSAHAVATLTVSDVALQPGESAPITVTLSTGGDDIAGTENRLGFPGELTVSDCEVNPAINKSATAFAGTNPITALVLALNNTDAIADGSVLYTCTATVDGGAADGDYEIGCTGAGASDPAGNSIDTDCVNGTVTVTGPPLGTIVIGSVTGAPGSMVSVDVSLTVTGGTEIAGTENVLTFAAGLSGGTAAGGIQLHDCIVNPAINKGGTAFSFQPSACTEGATCESMKSLVLAFDNTAAIPSGSVLYTCQVAIGPDAEGTYPLTCSEPGASDGEGVPVFVDCADGSVTVAEATPTATMEPTSTNTPVVPTAVPTGEVTATATNTATNTPTNTRVRVSDEDDGCAVVEPRGSSAGWTLLLPLAVLFWSRRRTH